MNSRGSSQRSPHGGPLQPLRLHLGLSVNLGAFPGSKLSTSKASGPDGKDPTISDLYSGLLLVFAALAFRIHKNGPCPWTPLTPGVRGCLHLGLGGCGTSSGPSVKSSGSGNSRLTAAGVSGSLLAGSLWTAMGLWKRGKEVVQTS